MKLKCSSDKKLSEDERKEHLKEYRNKYRSSPSSKAKTKEYLESDKGKKSRSGIVSRYRAKCRVKLIKLLGGVCSNKKCGCTDIRCIELDHVSGGGCIERKDNGGRPKTARYYLTHLDEAKEKIQLLCSNCNRIKQYEQLEGITDIYNNIISIELMSKIKSMTVKWDADGFWYVCCPYSHEDERIVNARYNAAVDATAWLIKQNCLVYCSVLHWRPVALAHDLPHDYEFWKEFDVTMIKKSAGLIILMMDGWDKSKGVIDEIRVGKENSKPILYI